MKEEALTLLAALVAQHNGVSIPAYLWVAFGVWSGVRLGYIAFTAMADEVRKRAQV